MTVTTIDKASCRVVLGDWNTCGDDAAQIRHEVFVVEQKVPLEEEMDARDGMCIHAVVYGSDGTPLATGRLLPDGHIGRMAVRAQARRSGLGSLVLESLMEEARKRGHREVVLAAQTHAQPFYAAHGFEVLGGVFLDAGIDHVNMRKPLAR